jgi:hypothetical protein
MRRIWKTCEACQGRFYGRGVRFCSAVCAHAPRSLETRFWEKVEARDPGVCWPWLGGKQPSGYGRLVTHDRGLVGAHVVSWEVNRGERNGLHVLHRCDNPNCVNPGHLFLGTNDDNIADKMAKQRQKRTLSIESARSVRELHASGVPQRAIARALGVSRGCIQGVLRRRSWRYVA